MSSVLSSWPVIFSALLMTDTDDACPGMAGAGARRASTGAGAGAGWGDGDVAAGFGTGSLSLRVNMVMAASPGGFREFQSN